MFNSRGIRPYIWPTVFFVLITFLFVLPMIYGELGRENYIALALVALFIIYSVLEFRAMNSTSEEVLDDSLIGRQAIVTEAFRDIAGGFEGRVMVNGAPWSARSEERRMDVGDMATVDSLDGQILQLKLNE